MTVQAGSIGKRRNSATAALLLGGAVALLALPSAVLAFATGFGPAGLVRVAEVEPEAGFQPAQVDPRLARSISVRALGKGQTFRFTPGASPSRLDRSVSLAVRGAAGRGAQSPGAAADDAASSFGIAPTAYNLGGSRGYKGFAPGVLPRTDAQMPDLRSFAPSPGPKGAPSRFSPRIALDEREQAGRAPRTLQGQADEVVDLGGSYRLTRNLNVTAGVRSTSDRDRLAPLSDGRKDNQAVYVGTQLKF
ncbi:hypothetical protein [Novosphingobium sp.]|uniref:hypothetical protein n=1 Tax=Novosphingobium sp. TaxID=1874826 RepID=UPI0022C11BF9|nr:hypothetical protein [Novosphingobium sp.]MCZ8017913.1 hypothetical protein [Novosphingobium sp.]MCZ8034232.1 hypothetical protein [Novosphingobium sp.]MCZ8052200.1 hypothetical protein [Novosphingobium sp.]MCZ8061372.1 hypothetical protein [Novosphingobium sp.]MCZ8232696.1 hypothetical protein [Novosphingobium sp.]